MCGQQVAVRQLYFPSSCLTREREMLFDSKLRRGRITPAEYEALRKAEQRGSLLDRDLLHHPTNTGLLQQQE